MGQDSKIEWCHHSLNLWWGCTEVHEGCDHCYARVWAKRWGKDVWGTDVPREIKPGVWDAFRKCQRLAAEAGEIHLVFTGSMMDIFEKPMPVIDSKGKLVMVNQTHGHQVQLNTGMLRDRFFNEVVPGCPNLMFLLLTKRPSNINKYIPSWWKIMPPENVMFGTSVVDQKTANKLIPQLFQVKGKRFLSVEPQLGPIDFENIVHRICEENEPVKPLFGTTEILDILNGDRIHGNVGYDFPKIDWIIQGGESGTDRRPFDLNWAYDLSKKCKKASVPYFFKQVDKVKEIPENLFIREFPKN